MLRMYEIFNQRGANTKKAQLSGRADDAPVVPAQPGRRQATSTGRSATRSTTPRPAVLTALELTSRVPAMVVENYYKKSLNAVTRGRPGAVRASSSRLARAIRRRSTAWRICCACRPSKCSRATAEIKVKEGTFPAGSYIVKMNQPYGPLAKTLLEKQVYPDPALTTYDDSAWTMGLASNVEVKTIEDKAILDAPATLLTADVVDGRVNRQRGRRAASGVLVVRHNGALNLITLRYRLEGCRR